MRFNAKAYDELFPRPVIKQNKETEIEIPEEDKMIPDKKEVIEEPLKEEIDEAEVEEDKEVENGN